MGVWVFVQFFRDGEGARVHRLLERSPRAVIRFCIVLLAEDVLAVAYYVRRLIDSADSINCDRIGRFFIGFSLGLVLGIEPLSVPHLPVDLHINIPDDFELIDVLI